MGAYTTTDRPITSILAGVGALGRDEEQLKHLQYELRSLCMDFHMCRSDMPYNPKSGTQSEPDEVTEQTERTKRWVKAAHDAGVSIVIPYICNQSIVGGKPEDRTGIWGFWDRWTDYAADMGPKPEANPIDWMQREPDGSLHFNYPFRYQPTSFRWAPCPNNPYWHEFLKQNVRLLAEYGYDGVFVDNNIIHCHCEHCQAGFREYIRERYDAQALKEAFGVSDYVDMRLSTAGDKILRAESRPEYLDWIKRNEPEEFQCLFGTNDLSEAVIAQAGNGFHWGRAYDFWLETMETEYGADELLRMRREGDLSSVGIHTMQDRLLWAETQKFWAYSIGQRNKELRDAAHERAESFAIVPNWGDAAGPPARREPALGGKEPAPLAPRHRLSLL